MTTLERRRESAAWLALALAATLVAAIPRLGGLALPTRGAAGELWWSLPRLLLVAPALAAGLGVAPLRLLRVAGGAPGMALGLAHPLRAPAPWEEVTRNASWTLYRWPAPRRLAEAAR